ncbi:hypothetical protein A2Z00_04225 [Candidatus Gottesmanbacteria bacterium RBG_13_45_10]|uniref:Uncharacterized protein n=1 Tax=Candidatus Gottesmanbacteria bacterium RBG_13_45_10 TaxID=1798370 RepID=A0A1F5ZHB2_9BACT|nr:MAG: hypothetical protein A2Z00_04225 [Candidatus Gottesmanbacteria bacterium RBG_13_45_10]
MVETRFEESAPTSIDPFAPIRIAEGYDLGKASQDRINAFLGACGMIDQWSSTLTSLSQSPDEEILKKIKSDVALILNMQRYMTAIILMDRVSHVHAVADIAQHEVDYLTSHKIYTGELSQMRHEIDVAGSVMVQELISLIDGARDTFGLPKTSKPFGPGRLFRSDVDTNFFHAITVPIVHDYFTKPAAMYGYCDAQLQDAISPDEALSFINNAIENIPTLYENNKKMLTTSVEPLAARSVFEAIAKEIRGLAPDNHYRGITVNITIDDRGLSEELQTVYSTSVAASYGRNLKENIQKILDEMIDQKILQPDISGLFVSLAVRVTDGKLEIVNKHNIRPYPDDFDAFQKGKSRYETPSVQQISTGMAMWGHKTIAEGIRIGEMHGWLAPSNEQTFDDYGNPEKLAVTTLTLPVRA